MAHYWPQRSCGQGYVFNRVCDSVNGGGGMVPGVSALGGVSGVSALGGIWSRGNNSRPLPPAYLLECILVSGMSKSGNTKMNFLSLSSMLEFSVDNSTEDLATTIRPDDYRVCSKEGGKFKTIAIRSFVGSFCATLGAVWW